MRPWAAPVLLLPLLTAGCFQALLREGTGSALEFTCAVLDPAVADTVAVESWMAPGEAFDAAPVLARLAVVLADLAGRDPGAVVVSQAEGPAVPDGGWNRSRLADAAQPFLRQRTVTLRVLWVPSMAEPATGMVAGPGTVAVALDSVRAAAQQLGRDPGAVALAVLLHQVGHALGQVNRGVPVQDPDIQEREGPAGHDRDPAAVLNVAWDDARTVAWAANATYDHYGAADLADWAAARRPGGVCT